MTLTELRALLKAAGYRTPSAVEIDRFDVKREHGNVVGVDVMFTDGEVARLPVEGPEVSSGQ